MTEAMSEVTTSVAPMSIPQGAIAGTSAPRTQGQIIWGKFVRHKAAVISAIVLLILAVLCFGAPFFAPYPFDAIDLRNARQPPSLEHIMGTDDLGRDVFTRILYGGRISLMVGIFAAAFATIIGSLLGAVSGYYGGMVDNASMRFTEVMIAIPTLPLLIIISSYAARLGAGHRDCDRRAELDGHGAHCPCAGSLDQAAGLRARCAQHWLPQANDHRPAHHSRTSWGRSLSAQRWAWAQRSSLSRR